MKQFILAGSVAYTDKDVATEIANGALGVYYFDDGIPKVTATGAEVVGKGLIALGRTEALGGPMVYPIHSNKFSYVKGVYKAATTFTTTVTIPKPTAIGSHGVMIVKKGKDYNERYKYSHDVYVKDTTMTADTLADKLAAAINANSNASGVKATATTGDLTITALEKGVDYEVIWLDELMGLVATSTTAGTPAYGDAAYVSKLARECAADQGANYTYGKGEDMYPFLPVNPLAQPDKADTGFTIFTIKFTEPRDVGPSRNDVVNQIVHIALPTGSAQIATLETVFKAIAGE